jgi:iron(III) transport system permease protein
VITHPGVTWSRGRQRRSKGIRAAAATLAILLLAFLFLAPIVVLILTSFREGTPGNPGGWSLDRFLEVLSSPQTWLVTLNSVILAFSATFLAVTVGALLAWVGQKTTTPLRRFFTPAMVVLMLIPNLFYGLGWVLIMRGSKSPFAMIGQWLGLSEPIPSSGWVVLIVLVAGFVVPPAYLFMLGPIGKLDAAMDDAARVSGASRWSVARTITFPLLRPSLFGVFVLMASYAFSAFELPLLFGSPAGINVFSTAVFNASSGATGTPDYAGAATLSTILVVFVTVLVLVRWLTVGRKQVATITGKGYRPEPRDYGRMQWVFCAFFILVILISGVFPILQMVLGSFQSLFGVSAALTTENYAKLFADRESWAAIRTTLTVASIGGLLTVVIAVPLAYAAKKLGGWVRAFAGLVTWAPASIPGVVVGLALITAYLPVPGLRNLFGTIWFLLIGFVVVVMPIATRAVEGSIAQVSTELEDSARVSGAGPIRAFLSVTGRLVLPSFFAGWFLGGIVISGNLSLPSLLSTPALQTVAVRAYNLYSQGEIARAAALFIVMMLVLLTTALAVYLAYRAVRAVVWLVRRRKTRQTSPEALKAHKEGMTGEFKEEMYVSSSVGSGAAPRGVRGGL